MAYGACDAPDAEYASRISYWIGPEGTVKKAYAEVDAKSHPDQVLGDIET